jgi:hypothetical protein
MVYGEAWEASHVGNAGCGTMDKEGHRAKESRAARCCRASDRRSLSSGLSIELYSSIYDSDVDVVSR